MARVEVEAGGVVAGGAALAREEDGRIVFVTGALPGERVVAEVVRERKDFRQAVVVEVLEPSRDRVAPPCPNLAAGCGGCAWQHVAREAQPRLKVDIVRDALRRIAHVDDVEQVDIATIAVPASGGLRTTVRVAVNNGRAAFHGSGDAGDELVDAGGCLVAHPQLADLLADGWFGDATEAVLRTSVATGQRVALVTPSATGVRLPDDVVVVGARADGLGAIEEVVGGRTFRVSIRSFFQPNPAVAETLASAAADAVGELAVGARVADLYAGVGVLGASIAARAGASVVAVEQSGAAVADARRNLADLDALVVHGEVARWHPQAAPFAAVVADPARPGLGRPGVGAVARASAPALALVSCDAASFARDVGLLGAAGYLLDSVRVVDAFPDTPHVEVVSRFARPPQ